MGLPKFMIECLHQITQLFQHFFFRYTQYKVFLHESVEESLQRALLPKLSLTHFKVKYKTAYRTPINVSDNH